MAEFEFDDDDDDVMITGPKDPINKIEDFLYLGDIYAAENGKILRENNIQKIVSCLETFTLFRSFDHIEYHRIQIEDSMYSNITTFLPDAIRFISNAQKNHQNVLVHCAAGISRSPTVVIAYLMVKYNYEMNYAMQLVYRGRRGICPNDGFLRQLMVMNVSEFKTSILY